MKKFNIPISKPNLTANDKKEVLKCLDSSWISSKSPWVGKFERKFARVVAKTKFAAAVNSGTSALYLALIVLGIGEGDEVIIPTLTMIATVNAVTWTGAKPVLVDCTSEEDWNMSVAQIEKKITKKTKAIIPVHLYGYTCDMDQINNLAKKHGLYVVEDAAEAMGSTYMGKRAGSLSNIACYSLYANKIITTGNGGMVVSNNENYINKIKRLSFFDFNKEEHFNHKLVAYNLVMSGLQAALGLSQIERFMDQLNDRKRIYRLWKEYFRIKGATFVKPKKTQKPNYWFPVVLFSSPNRLAAAEKELTKIGVETRRMFRPVHLQEIYSKYYTNENFPNSEYFFDNGLLLPSYYGLKKSEVRDISDILSSRLG